MEVALQRIVRSTYQVVPDKIQRRTLKAVGAESSEIHTEVVFSKTGVHGEPVSVPVCTVTVVCTEAVRAAPTVKSAL